MERNHNRTSNDSFECQECGKDFKIKTGRSIQMGTKHGINDDDREVYHCYEC